MTLHGRDAFDENFVIMAGEQAHLIDCHTRIIFLFSWSSSDDSHVRCVY